MTAHTKPSALANQDWKKVRAAISRGPGRPFLVTLDRLSSSSTELTIHFAREAVGFAIKTSHHLTQRDFSSRIAALGIDIPTRVKFYRRRALEKPRSLEQFIAKFGLGERIYDPTGVFDEAEHLVNFARHLRQNLADKLKGIYWSSGWRTIYVLLDEKAFADGYSVLRERLVAAERTVANAYEASARHRGVRRADQLSKDRSDEFESAPSDNVRLCFSTPAVPLVPIDDASIADEFARRRILRRFLEPRTFTRIPLLTVLFGMGSASVALADTPAVENTLLAVESTIAAPAVPARDTRSSIDGRIDRAPLLPAAASSPFPGGPGLHLFWRDAFRGAVGRSHTPRDGLTETWPSGSHANYPSDNDEAITRDRFQEIARSVGTFSGAGAISSTSMLDLKWFADSERTTRSGPDTRPKTSRSTVMQSGVAAVLGLSNLIGSQSSDAVSTIVLEDLRSHFGLPRSLQIEARWHFDETALSSIPSRQAGPLLRTALITRYENYRDWLRQTTASNTSNYQGESQDRREAQFREPHNPLGVGASSS